jgi:flagellar protein FliS
MRTNRYQSYFDNEILSAHPLGLIQLLYRGALDSISSARHNLKLGDIRARSRAISKAIAILTELSGSLDHSVAQELTKNLAGLYAYIQNQLVRANIEQSDPPLAEAERLLSTLCEAWQNCQVANASDEVDPGTLQVAETEPVGCAY